MPIAYSTIRTLLASSLDAEGSDRYLDQQDYIPAINYAIDYVTLVFNSIFSEKKLSEEVLKELTYVKIWNPSIYSRVAFDSTIVGMDLWTILAVYPNPTFEIQGSVPSKTSESAYIPTASYLSSKYSAKRLTLEEWNEKDRNIFSAGSSDILCAELKQYGWVNFANYTGYYTLANNKFEIEIAPALTGDEVVAIAFLKKPTKITAITDNVEFPDVLTNLIYSTALNYITLKQNNAKVSLYETSALDKKNIISLLT